MVPHPVQLVKTFSPFCVDSISLVKAQIQQVYLLPSELRRVTVSPNVFRHVVRIAAFPAPACCPVPKPGLRASVFRDGSSPRLYQGSIVTVMQCNKQTNEPNLSGDSNMPFPFTRWGFLAGCHLRWP